MYCFTKEAGHTLACRNQNVSAFFAASRSLYAHCRCTCMWLMLAWMTWVVAPRMADAQSPIQQGISGYVHGLAFVDVSGDTMILQFDLGSLNKPANNVVGFEVDIHFPRLTSSATQIWMNAANGWLAAQPSDMQCTFDPITATLHSRCLRADAAPVTGHGQIATIYVVRPGGFAKPENVAQLDGGGIIMIDDMDFKMAPITSPTANSLSISPNPAHDYLNVSIAGVSPMTLMICDLQGHVWQHAVTQEFQKIDLTTLPRGFYCVQLRSKSGIVATQKLVLE